MNIAFFLFTYPGIGGTETVSNLLAEWFTKKGGGMLMLKPYWSM